MKRMAMAIGVKPDQIALCNRLQANVRPKILQRLTGANICTYAIFRRGFPARLCQFL